MGGAGVEEGFSEAVGQVGSRGVGNGAAERLGQVGGEGRFCAGEVAGYVALHLGCGEVVCRRGLVRLCVGWVRGWRRGAGRWWRWRFERRFGLLLSCLLPSS